MLLNTIIGPQKVYMFYLCFSNQFIKVCLSDLPNSFITFSDTSYRVVDCKTKQFQLLYYQNKEIFVKKYDLCVS